MVFLCWYACVCTRCCALWPKSKGYCSESSSIFRSLADLRHGGMRFKQEGDFSTSHTCLVVFYCPTAKTSVFIEVLTLGEDQSIKCIRTRSFLLHPKILEFTLLLPWLFSVMLVQPDPRCVKSFCRRTRISRFLYLLYSSDNNQTKIFISCSNVGSLVFNCKAVKSFQDKSATS